MKKYAIVVLLLLCCFKNSFGMNDTWIGECIKMHSALRSFVETFDCASGSEKIMNTVKHLEGAHEALLNALTASMVPLDGKASQDFQEAFLKQHRQLLCVPWLVADEATKVLECARNNTLEKQQDRRALCVLVHTMGLSVTTMLLMKTVIANAPSYWKQEYDGRYSSSHEIFHPYEERSQRAKSFIPLLNVLLDNGACIAGEYYHGTDTGIEKGKWHMFSRVNDLPSEFIEVLLEREGKDVVNTRCCPNDDSYPGLSSHIPPGPITPLAQALKNETGNFHHARNLPVLRTLLKYGARLDVDGAQGALSDFMSYMTGVCCISQEDVLAANVFVKQLLAQRIVPIKELADVHTILLDHGKLKRCTWALHQGVSDREKLPHCVYEELCKDVEVAMESHKSAVAQRVGRAPTGIRGKNDKKYPQCLTS